MPTMPTLIIVASSRFRTPRLARMEAPGEPGRGGDHRRDRECDQPTRDGPEEEEPRVRSVMIARTGLGRARPLEGAVQASTRSAKMRGGTGAPRRDWPPAYAIIPLS